MKPEGIPQSAVDAGARRLSEGYWQAPDGTACRPDEIAHAVLTGALDHTQRYAEQREQTIADLSRKLSVAREACAQADAEIKALVAVLRERHPDEQETLEVAREVAKACGGTVREEEHWFVIEPPPDTEESA